MAKNKNEEEIEQKKKELLESFERLKSDGLVNDDDINEFLLVIDEAIENSKKSTLRRLGRFLFLFFISLFVMYFASLVLFGLFYTNLTLENKPLIFLVALVISLPLVIYDKIPLYGIKFFRKYLILKYLLVMVLFIATLCFINTYVFQVFMFSTTWVFYVILLLIIYLIFASYIDRIL